MSCFLWCGCNFKATRSHWERKGVSWALSLVIFLPFYWPVFLLLHLTLSRFLMHSLIQWTARARQPGKSASCNSLDASCYSLRASSLSWNCFDGKYFLHAVLYFAGSLLHSLLGEQRKRVSYTCSWVRDEKGASCCPLWVSWQVAFLYFSKMKLIDIQTEQNLSCKPFAQLN